MCLLGLVQTGFMVHMVQGWFKLFLIQAITPINKAFQYQGLVHLPNAVTQPESPYSWDGSLVHPLYRVLDLTNVSQPSIGPG